MSNTHTAPSTPTPPCFDNGRCVGHERYPGAGTLNLRYCDAKTVPAFDPREHSSTAMAAVALCSACALSPECRKRDAYLDRLAEMSEDELAEHTFACEELS